jgi:hypothetical protein
MLAFRSRTILGCRPFPQGLAAVDVEAVSRCMVQVHSCCRYPPKPRNVIHEHVFLNCKLEEVMRHTELLVRVWLLCTVPHAELLETDRVRTLSIGNVLKMISSHSIISLSNITRVRIGSDDDDHKTCFLSDTNIVCQLLMDASSCPQLCAPDASKSLSE